MPWIVSSWRPLRSRRRGGVGLPLAAATGRAIPKSRIFTVPAKAIIVSGCMILFSPLVNAIPGVSGAFVLFASAASAVVIFIYILTMLAHRLYRQSADFLPDCFVMPAWQVCDWIAIAFYVFVYVTLFLSADTRGSAIAGLLWLVVFGGYCLLHERFQNRDLKAALGK